MSTTNSYAKHYLNRRTIPETEVYKLVLFPSDNSIAVVKAKQCSPAEHDGFVFVQSGRKKFTGVVLQEGTLMECGHAADQLTRKTVNPEIESDYERHDDENSSKRHKRNPPEIPSLLGVPFAEKDANIQSDTQSRIDIGVDKSNEFDSPLSSSGSKVTKNGEVSVNETLSITRDKSCTSSSSIEVLSKLQTHRQQSRQKPLPNASFDEKDDSSSASSETEDEVPVNIHVRSHPERLTTNETPTFVGRHVTEDNTKSKNKKHKSSTSTSATLQQLLITVKKFESQYLKPILLKQEKN
ncbi:unnamed protein product [Adineta ricciae]|uniref:Uncharacterized protein n=2 Tax=Adineta ricciae TaxID=249248 RepID=A0A815RYG1_ADIRI|nr:unnamed protein product [Adineta ricciae]